MKLRHMVLMVFLAGCVCLPLSAQQVDNVTFSNTDGMFDASVTNHTLSLNNSLLTGISGFTGPLGGLDTTGTNLGTVNFTTGSLVSGSLVPLGNGVNNLTQTATFGAGGSLTIAETNGLTFTGTFSAATWQCVLPLKCSFNGSTGTGTWQFVGTLTNVVLTANGQQIPINGAVTFDATTVQGHVASMAGNVVSFTDQTGSTIFSMTVTPEPGTLALFGSGLIAMGALVKFSRPGRRDL